MDKTKSLQSSGQNESPAVGRNPLFSLGAVVATRAVASHLAQHAVSPHEVLSQHQCGDWGLVDPDDAESNNGALKTGARLLSAYDLAGERVWVITEGEDDEGRRFSTCLLFPEEY